MVNGISLWPLFYLALTHTTLEIKGFLLFVAREHVACVYAIFFDYLSRNTLASGVKETCNKDLFTVFILVHVANGSSNEVGLRKVFYFFTQLS